HAHRGRLDTSLLEKKPMRWSTSSICATVPSVTMQIPFIDLATQQQRLQPAIDDAIKRVLDHGGYIMGPEVALLEKELAAFCGARHALGCANGTDALQLALMALGAKAGDAIFVPAFT